MPIRLRFVHVVVGWALLPLASASAQVPHFATNDLQNRGLAAYHGLPDQVTLLDAPRFAVALAFLYAYEQRMNREHRAVPRVTQENLDWMQSSIDDMKTSKGDGLNRSDENMRDSGLAMYKKARASVVDATVWNVRAYLSATRDLFAYLQVTPKPRPDAASAYQWLASSRLVASAVKGDGANSSGGWLPRGTRPGAKAGPHGAIAGKEVDKQHGSSIGHDAVKPHSASAAAATSKDH